MQNSMSASNHSVANEFKPSQNITGNEIDSIQENPTAISVENVVNPLHEHNIQEGHDRSSDADLESSASAGHINFQVSNGDSDNFVGHEGDEQKREYTNSGEAENGVESSGHFVSDSTENNAGKRRKRRRPLKGTRYFCKGNPIRACHESELDGGQKDARCRCAICGKKSTFFCIDCEQWFCMSTRNDIPGEDKYLRFSIITSGRNKSRKRRKNNSGEDRSEEKEDKDRRKKGTNNTSIETMYAYRSCWNIFHSDVLQDHLADGENIDPSIQEGLDGGDEYLTVDSEETTASDTKTSNV